MGISSGCEFYAATNCRRTQEAWSYWTTNDRALLVPAPVVTDVSCARRAADWLTRNVAVILLELTTTTLLTLTPLPWTVTLAGEVKFVPVSVTVILAPRDAALGASDVRVGFTGAGKFTVKGCAALVPALVEMVTLRAPMTALEAMTNVAVTLLELTTVTPVTETPVPLIATVAPAWKLEPLRVTATFVPCVPLLGAMEVRTGAAGGEVMVTTAVPTAEGETVLAA